MIFKTYFYYKTEGMEKMTISTILFDLDGTLLPMDQDQFTRDYFRLLAKKLAPRGYNSQKLIDTIWAGTAAMVKNDGSQMNETVFWRKFADVYGEDALSDKPLFEEFYREDFQQAKTSCGYDPQAAESVALARDLGFQVVLATNPIFPAVAVESRMRWAGLDPEDFIFYTTYENIGHSKPDPCYYRDIARRLGVPPEGCCMVGNDVDEDMIAATIGMRVFLLTDCLINRRGLDIARYPHGGHGKLQDLLRSLASQN